MGSENEIKRLTCYIWGQWLIIICLLISVYIIRLTIVDMDQTLLQIRNSIIAQQEACNGVAVKLDNVDQQIKEIRKTIGGEW